MAAHSQGNAVKPKECEIACPPQQVCDYCQGTDMTDTRPAPHDALDADKIGLKSELNFLRSLAEILAPLDGGLADVRRALDAISTMRMVLSKAPRSETVTPQSTGLDVAEKWHLDLADKWKAENTVMAQWHRNAAMGLRSLKNSAPQETAAQEYELKRNAHKDAAGGGSCSGDSGLTGSAPAATAPKASHDWASSSSGPVPFYVCEQGATIEIDWEGKNAPAPKLPTTRSLLCKENCQLAVEAVRRAIEPEASSPNGANHHLEGNTRAYRLYCDRMAEQNYIAWRDVQDCIKAYNSAQPCVAAQTDEPVWRVRNDMAGRACRWEKQQGIHNGVTIAEELRHWIDELDAALLRGPERKQP